MIMRLQNLRDQIARLEGFAPPRLAQVCATGWPALDRALPGGGLLRGALHELHAPDPADGAAMGFAAHLLARFLADAPGRAALWASCRPDLFAPGLLAQGVDPGRLLMVKCADTAECLFAFEEALGSPAIAIVGGDIGAVDFTLSRRLHLAAAGGATLLLLRPAPFAAAPSAAVTRWHVEARPGGGWSLALFRCRGGQPHSWLLPESLGAETQEVAS